MKCSGGTCPSGCDTSLPSGYTWSGPSCQIDNEVLCGYHHDPVYTSITITCPSPLIGRYVHFMRKVGVTKDEAAPFCEVVIIGHRNIDCTQCPVGVNCNDVTGCVACQGSYQPDCKQRCEDGVYGTNCQDQCGHCKTNIVCDRYNGTCHDGCQIWWTDTKCNTYIETPNNTDENLMVLNKTSDSIEIGWEHINGISENLRGFYGYLIQYSIDLDYTNYRDVGIVSYDSDPYWKIENLQINTIYYIKVTPYRKFGDRNETGKAYDTLEVKTDCSAPNSSSFINATLTYSDSGLPNISVTWQMISSIEPHCDNITGISLQYKLSTSTNVTSINLNPDVNMFVIVPDVEGQYDIKLIIKNNKGYTSSSERRGIHVNCVKSNTRSSSTHYNNEGFQSDGIDTEDNMENVKKLKSRRKHTTPINTNNRDTGSNM
ncbi:hypothetical protein LSH36_1879g00026, partial [Paralvinella palmiformis]